MTDDLVRRLRRVLETGKNEGTPPAPLAVPVAEYTDPRGLELELREALRRRPLALLPSATVAAPGTRVSRELLGVPLLVTRDLTGRLNVFENRCRHRGAALLGEGDCSQGQRLVCPYHGWTYGLDGAALHIPEQEIGFPGIERDAFSLIRVPSVEVAGMVWVCLDAGYGAEPGSAGRSPIVDPRGAVSSLEGLRDELEPFGLGACRVVDARPWRCACNWKLGVNAFLETYHFRTAHRTSVATVFAWNRLLIDAFGENLRLTLPRLSFAEQLAEHPADRDELRRHVSFVYFFFPCSFLSILPDHASFISFHPDGVDGTRVESHLFVPEGSPERSPSYWERNAALFAQTVAEDLALCASIQRGIAHDRGGSFTFATFEHGLVHFRDALRRLTTPLAEPSARGFGGRAPIEEP